MQNQDKLEKIRRYARLLDSQFTIPFLNFKFGIDPLLSLIPGIGSFSGLVTGSILIYMAIRQGVSGQVRVMMIRNTIIDFLWGMFPILGNVKDFLYKSNIRNLTVLEEHWLEGQYTGTGAKQILQLGLGFLLLLIISAIVFVYSVKLFLAILA